MITTVNKFILYSSYFPSESLEISPLLNLERKDFAGLPVVNTLGFHCRGHRKKNNNSDIYQGFFLILFSYQLLQLYCTDHKTEVYRDTPTEKISRLGAPGKHRETSACKQARNRQGYLGMIVGVFTFFLTRVDSYLFLLSTQHQVVNMFLWSRATCYWQCLL